MHNLLSGVLLGSADLLDDYVMKNAFEYEEKLAELQATIAQLETKLNNAINLDFERREEIAKLTAENERLELVPKVATLEMKNAGWQECERQGVDPESIEMQTIWTAMQMSSPNTRPSRANAPADSGTHPHNDGLDDYRGKV